MMSMGFTGSTHSSPADVTVPHKQQRRLLTAMQVSRLQPGDLAQLLKTPSSESTSTTDEPSSVDWDKPSYVCAMPFVSPSLLFPKERLASYIFPSTSPSTRRLSNAPNRSVTTHEEEKEAGKEGPARNLLSSFDAAVFTKQQSPPKTRQECERARTTTNIPPGTSISFFWAPQEAVNRQQTQGR